MSPRTQNKVREALKFPFPALQTWHESASVIHWPQPQEEQGVRTMENDRRDLRPCCCPSCACERGVFESGAVFARRPSFYCWAARRRVRRDVEIFLGDDRRRGGQGMTTATEAQKLGVAGAVVSMGRGA